MMFSYVAKKSVKTTFGTICWQVMEIIVRQTRACGNVFLGELVVHKLDEDTSFANCAITDKMIAKRESAHHGDQHETYPTQTSLIIWWDFSAML